jgi:hypothetical protein
MAAAQKTLQQSTDTADIQIARLNLQILESDLDLQDECADKGIDLVIMKAAFDTLYWTTSARSTDCHARQARREAGKGPCTRSQVTAFRVRFLRIGFIQKAPSETTRNRKLGFLGLSARLALSLTAAKASKIR